MPEVNRRNLPPLDELIAICGGEGRGEGEPRDLRRLYARVVRRLSILITRGLLPTGISANETTVLGIAIGIAGAVMLAFNDLWAQLGGLLLLQLSFVLDFCDGEVARFEREIEGKSTGQGGAYLDWVGHYYVPATITAAVGWAVFSELGAAWVWVAACIVIFALLRVPYSARDHIMLSVYRDRPELRNDPVMVRAALSRMGGDPAAVDLERGAETRMSGVPGKGLLWSRFTNVGQLLVFPGYINIVLVATLGDIALGLEYPEIESVDVRAVLLAGLAAIHLVHQARAIWQSYRIVRAFE